MSVIKQNPAEKCLCAYQVFNSALILSDTCMHIRQQCPCKNNLPWQEFPSAAPGQTPAYTPVSHCFLFDRVVAWFFLLPGIQVGCGLQDDCVVSAASVAPVLPSGPPADLSHLLCCKMWAFVSMNFVKKCFITILSGFWARQWPHSIKEPCCGRWGCQSVQSDMF